MNTSTIGRARLLPRFDGVLFTLITVMRVELLKSQSPTRFTMYNGYRAVFWGIAFLSVASIQILRLTSDCSDWLRTSQDDFWECLRLRGKRVWEFQILRLWLLTSRTGFWLLRILTAFWEFSEVSPLCTMTGEMTYWGQTDFWLLTSDFWLLTSDFSDLLSDFWEFSRSQCTLYNDFRTDLLRDFISRKRRMARDMALCCCVAAAPDVAAATNSSYYLKWLHYWLFLFRIPIRRTARRRRRALSLVLCCSTSWRCSGE